MAENDTNAGTGSSDNTSPAPTQSETEGNPPSDTGSDLTFPEWQQFPKEDKGDTKRGGDKANE